MRRGYKTNEQKATGRLDKRKNEETGRNRLTAWKGKKAKILGETAFRRSGCLYSLTSIMKAMNIDVFTETLLAEFLSTNTCIPFVPCQHAQKYAENDVYTGICR